MKIFFIAVFSVLLLLSIVFMNITLTFFSLGMIILLSVLMAVSVGKTKKL